MGIETVAGFTMKDDDPKYLEKLSTMLTNWIGKAHPPQRLYDVSLLPLLKNKLRKLWFSSLRNVYQKTFLKFSKNPGNFSASGTASGMRV